MGKAKTALWIYKNRKLLKILAVVGIAALAYWLFFA